MDLGLVCDGCGAFNELGIGSCGSCSSSLSLDSNEAADLHSLQSMDVGESTQSYGSDLDHIDDEPTDSTKIPVTQSCATCGAMIASGNRFCGACGTPMGASAPAFAATPRSPAPSGSTGKKTLFFSSIQAAKAKLVVIKGEGNDGESYALAGDDHRIGRSDADIVFEEDEFLSPTHANFFYVQGNLHVQDEGSTNGVYIRIRDSCPLEDENFFLVGEQVIQVHSVPSDPGLRATEDGTYIYASPRRQAKFELIQILHGGGQGIKHPSVNDVITLGREENDINFPEDPFISGHHAQVTGQGQGLTLTDLGSKNGTFVRITKETPLSHGDYVFMGQQLLRVEIV